MRLFGLEKICQLWSGAAKDGGSRLERLSLALGPAGQVQLVGVQEAGIETGHGADVEFEVAFASRLDGSLSVVDPKKPAALVLLQQGVCDL